MSTRWIPKNIPNEGTSWGVKVTRHDSTIGKSIRNLNGSPEIIKVRMSDTRLSTGEVQSFHFATGYSRAGVFKGRVQWPSWSWFNKLQQDLREDQLNFEHSAISPGKGKFPVLPLVCRRWVKINRAANRAVKYSIFAYINLVRVGSTLQPQPAQKTLTRGRWRHHEVFGHPKLWQHRLRRTPRDTNRKDLLQFYTTFYSSGLKAEVSHRWDMSAKRRWLEGGKNAINLWQNCNVHDWR